MRSRTRPPREATGSSNETAMRGEASALAARDAGRDADRVSRRLSMVRLPGPGCVLTSLRPNARTSASVPPRCASPAIRLTRTRTFPESAPWPPCTGSSLSDDPLSDSGPSGTVPTS